VFCLDTGIVIFALNKRLPRIDERLQEELAAGTHLLIPTIVLFELTYGIAKSRQSEASARVLEAFLLGRFDVIRFDADDAAEAGDIRAHLEAKGTPIGPYDLLIAAQARRRRVALVTTNRHEFERVPGLIVTDWTTWTTSERPAGFLAPRLSHPQAQNPSPSFA